MCVVKSAFEKDMFSSAVWCSVLCRVLIKLLNCGVQPFFLTDFIFCLLDQLLKEVY